MSKKTNFSNQINDLEESENLIFIRNHFKRYLRKKKSNDSWWGIPSGFRGISPKIHWKSLDSILTRIRIFTNSRLLHRIKTYPPEAKESSCRNGIIVGISIRGRNYWYNWNQNPSISEFFEKKIRKKVLLKFL